jgi:hypothetical protein
MRSSWFFLPNSLQILRNWFITGFEKMLLIKEILLFDTIMDFVCRKVKAPQTISQEQHIISNLVLIKELLSAQYTYGLYLHKGEDSELISKEKHMISNLQQIKDMLLLKSRMGFV